MIFKAPKTTLNDKRKKNIKKTNAENTKKWKILHRKKYLIDKNKLNFWNKFKKIYFNILLE